MTTTPDPAAERARLWERWCVFHAECEGPSDIRGWYPEILYRVVQEETAALREENKKLRAKIRGVDEISLRAFALSHPPVFPATAGGDGEREP